MRKFMNKVYRFFFPEREPLRFDMGQRIEPSEAATTLARELAQQVGRDEGINLPLGGPVDSGIPIIEIGPGDEVPGYGTVPEELHSSMGGIGVAVYLIRPEA